VVAFELVAEDAAPWHLTANRQELLMNQIDIVGSACSSANTAFEQWAKRNASVYRDASSVMFRAGSRTRSRSHSPPFHSSSQGTDLDDRYSGLGLEGYHSEPEDGGGENFHGDDLWPQVPLTLVTSSGPTPKSGHVKLTYIIISVTNSISSTGC